MHARAAQIRSAVGGERFDAYEFRGRVSAGRRMNRPWRTAPRLKTTVVFNGDTDPCVSYEGTREAVRAVGYEQLPGGEAASIPHHTTPRFFKHEPRLVSFHKAVHRQLQQHTCLTSMMPQVERLKSKRVKAAAAFIVVCIERRRAPARRCAAPLLLQRHRRASVPVGREAVTLRPRSRRGPRG